MNCNHFLSSNYIQYSRQIQAQALLQIHPTNFSWRPHRWQSKLLASQNYLSRKFHRRISPKTQSVTNCTKVLAKAGNRKKKSKKVLQLIRIWIKGEFTICRCENIYKPWTWLNQCGPVCACNTANQISFQIQNCPYSCKMVCKLCDTGHHTNEHTELFPVMPWMCPQTDICT